MPIENPKRLKPKPDTLRRLYLKSGNRCAYPDCSETMIDHDDVVIGLICHIEAAEPGGERFNPNQTNEERRSFANLVMMCHRHHVVTNDVDQYSVERMQMIKADHESKIADRGLLLGTAFEEQHTEIIDAVKEESNKIINLITGGESYPRVQYHHSPSNEAIFPIVYSFGNGDVFDLNVTFQVKYKEDAVGSQETRTLGAIYSGQPLIISQGQGSFYIRLNARLDLDYIEATLNARNGRFFQVTYFAKLLNTDTFRPYKCTLQKITDEQHLLVYDSNSPERDFF